MLLPIFTLNLNQRLLPHRVTVGKYDGLHCCLTAATTGDKVLIHSPHSRLDLQHQAGRIGRASAVDIAMLNIQQPITSVATGVLNLNSRSDILFVGTSTSLLAYDVHNNADLFYKEVMDGVNVIAVGQPEGAARPLAIAGGNCSLQGFDHEGNDPFWTVTGDNVTALVITDYDSDGNTELLVGSEDYDIRVFKQDEIIAEMSETEAVTALCALQGSMFAYSLANGTVGVYEQETRHWRIKSKNQAVSITSYDIDGDGVAELITGWTNGKIEARNAETGEIVFKDNFSQSVAGIFSADYKGDGQPQLVCCSVDGEVRGYGASAGGRRALMDTNVEQDLIRDLSLKKQSLLLELKNYEENERISGSGDAYVREGLQTDQIGIFPANTQVNVTLTPKIFANTNQGCVELKLEAPKDTVIRAALIFAEGIFEGECLVMHPKDGKLSCEMVSPLFPPKDCSYDLHVKVYVGYPGSVYYQVVELSQQLPRFSMYAAVDGDPARTPKSQVIYQIPDRTQRVVIWLNQQFLLTNNLEAATGEMDVSFVALRDGRRLLLRMDNAGKLIVRCDNVELMGDIVQLLAAFLNLDSLEAEADLPGETERISAHLDKIQEYNASQQEMTADMADSASIIRTLVIRAEDARLLGDTKRMRKWYGQLIHLNRDLINSYKIRCNNHNELLSCLRGINQVLQRAANLRVGSCKTAIIGACRSAINDNNKQLLFRIIRSGSSS